MKQRKEFENFLKRDWVISQTVEKRLDDIYKQLERKEEKNLRKHLLQWQLPV